MAEQHLRKTDSLMIVGASRGIGEAIVWLALERGYQNLWLVSRREAALNKLRRDILHRYPGANVQVHATDLCDEKSLMSFVHRLQSEDVFPRHWLLTFGGSPTGKLQREPYESTPWLQIDQLLDLNLRAPMRLLHQVIPELLRPNADGMVEPASVITLASQAAHEPVPGVTAYAAAKHGLYGFLRSLADEVREVGIRFSVISPGYVDTELVTSHPSMDRSKFIQANDVARAVLFAAECESPTAPFEIHLRPQRSPFGNR